MAHILFYIYFVLPVVVAFFFRSCFRP